MAVMGIKEKPDKKMTVGEALKEKSKDKVKEAEDNDREREV